MMARIEAIILAGTRILSTLGLLALLILAAMTIADGLTRSLAGQPIAGVRDVAALTIAVAVTCCLPIGLAERGNITIRFADAIGKKISGILDVIAAILVLVVMVLIANQFLAYAAGIARDGERTWVLKLPTAPFWYAVDVLLWCAVVVQFTIVLVEFRRVAILIFSPEREA